MKLQEALTALYSPRRRTQGISETSDYVGGLIRKQCIVSRGLCRYKRLNLNKVPAARRDDALRVKLEAWRPFDDPGFYTGWQGGWAHVWVWDRRKVPEDGASLLPETVLHPPGNGVRLVICIDGFEGQHWSGNELLHAQWWSSMPDSTAWVMFLRSAGLMPDEQLPAPEKLELLDRPWLRRMGAGGGANLLQRERQLVLGGAALAAFVLSWQLVGLYLDSSGRAALDAELRELQQSMQPQLEARSRALEDQDRIDALRALYPPYRQLQVMAQAAAQLPRQIQLVGWSLEDDELRFAIEGNEPDAGFWVKRFQDIDMYGEVTAERGRTPNQLALIMAVRPPSRSNEQPL